MSEVPTLERTADDFRHEECNILAIELHLGGAVYEAVFQSELGDPLVDFLYLFKDGWKIDMPQEVRGKIDHSPRPCDFPDRTETDYGAIFKEAVNIISTRGMQVRVLEEDDEPKIPPEEYTPMTVHKRNK